MKYTLLLVFGLATAYMQAQIDIQWGEPKTLNETFRRILPVDSTNFFAFYDLLAGPGDMISYTASGALVAKAHVGKSDEFTVEDAHVVHGKLLVFLSKRMDDTYVLYAQEYNKACLQTGEPVELLRYQCAESKKRKSFFEINTSPDKELFAVHYVTGCRNQEIGFKVYTFDFKEISSGRHGTDTAVSDDFDPAQQVFGFSMYYLSNGGDYFMLVKVYNFKAGKRDEMYPNYTTIQKVILFELTFEKLQEIRIDLTARKILDFNFHVGEDRVLTCTGVYADTTTENAEVQGIFYKRIQIDKGIVLGQGFHPCAEVFVPEGWFAKQNISNARQGNNKHAAELFMNHNLSAPVLLPDGSMVSMLEQHYEYRLLYRGPAESSWSIYDNGILAYKVLPDGRFAWVKNIPKYQQMTYRHPYMSATSFVNENALTIVLNDNYRNYDETGAWNEGVKPLNEANFYNSAALVQVNIDLENGELQRHVWRNRAKGFAFISLCAPDYQSNIFRMLMITQGFKRQFGTHSF